MNWVDFVILLVVVGFALDGIRQGFFSQLFNIIGFIFSLITALALYQPAAGLLIKLFNLPKIAANPVGFLIVWIIVESLFFGIFSSFFRRIFGFLQFLRKHLKER